MVARRRLRGEGVAAARVCFARGGGRPLVEPPPPAAAAKLSWLSGFGKHRQSRLPGLQGNLSGNTYTTRCCPKHRWGSPAQPAPGVCWSLKQNNPDGLSVSPSPGGAFEFQVAAGVLKANDPVPAKFHLRFAVLPGVAHHAGGVALHG